jgi:hypothetical protein
LFAFSLSLTHNLTSVTHTQPDLCHSHTTLPLSLTQNLTSVTYTEPYLCHSHTTLPLSLTHNLTSLTHHNLTSLKMHRVQTCLTTGEDVGLPNITCFTECVPDCTMGENDDTVKQCGENGCGGFCGECTGGSGGSRARTHTHAHTHKRTHTHTHARARTHTHTHTIVVHVRMCASLPLGSYLFVQTPCRDPQLDYLCHNQHSSRPPTLQTL